MMILQKKGKESSIQGSLQINSEYVRKIVFIEFIFIQ